MRDDLDLIYYQQRLEERLEAIMFGREAQQKDEEPIELDQPCVGRLSRMDAMHQQDMAQATARRAEQEKQHFRRHLIGGTLVES